MSDIFDIKNDDDLPFKAIDKSGNMGGRVLELIQKSTESRESVTPVQIRAAYFRTYNRVIDPAHLGVILQRLMKANTVKRMDRGQYTIKGPKEKPVATKRREPPVTKTKPRRSVQTVQKTNTKVRKPNKVRTGDSA